MKQVNKKGRWKWEARRLTMEEIPKRQLTLDIQVIAYLGDYLNIYKKSLEKEIRELSSQMSHGPLQSVPVNTASSRNHS